MPIVTLVALTYGATAVGAFVLGYYVAGIRELGLYYFMLLVNVPASWALMPVGEWLAGRLGWSVGGELHLWVYQLACACANAALLAATIAVVCRVRGAA